MKRNNYWKRRVNVYKDARAHNNVIVSVFYDREKSLVFNRIVSFRFPEIFGLFARVIFKRYRDARAKHSIVYLERTPNT